MAHEKAEGWLVLYEAGDEDRNGRAELCSRFAAHVLRELAEQIATCSPHSAEWKDISKRGLLASSLPVADWLRAEAEKLERGE